MNDDIIDINFKASLNEINTLDQNLENTLISIKQAASTKDKIALIKQAAKNLIDINHIYSDTENIIKKYNKKIGEPVYITDNILCLQSFLNKLTDNNTAKQILHELLQDDPKLTRIYFNTILYSWVKPNSDTLKVALDVLANNYDIVESLIFKNYGNLALVEIQRMNCNLPFKYNKIILASVQETCFKYWQTHLRIIWKKYGKKLFQRARRGPKLMLILFFLYHQHFTDEMFDVLVNRMKGYKNMFFIDYVLQYSLPEDISNRLNTLKLTLNIKG